MVLSLQIGKELSARCLQMCGAGNVLKGSEEDRNSPGTKRQLLIHQRKKERKKFRPVQGMLQSILLLGYMFPWFWSSPIPPGLEHRHTLQIPTCPPCLPSELSI